jgi:hypothetical protein
MADKPKQIIPIGGGGFYRDSENLALEKYVIAQSGAEHARVCFVPTASGEPDHYLSSFYAAFLKLGCRPSVLSFFKRTPDLRSFLLNQDVIFVGGGNTKSLLAVWRVTGDDEFLAFYGGHPVVQHSFSRGRQVLLDPTNRQAADGVHHNALLCHDGYMGCRRLCTIAICAATVFWRASFSQKLNRSAG